MEARAFTGEVLRDLRIKAGFATQNALARAMNNAGYDTVAGAHVSAWESGRVPRAKFFEGLIQVLGDALGDKVEMGQFYPPPA